MQSSDGKAQMVLQRDPNLQHYRRALPILQGLTGPVHRFFQRLSSRQLQSGRRLYLQFELALYLGSDNVRNTQKDGP